MSCIDTFALRLQAPRPTSALKERGIAHVDQNAMPETEHTQLTARIERVLGHEPRTRAEIALAVGYAGHDVSMKQALAVLVSDGQAIRTPAGWRAAH
jgi:hypothetical protein